MLRIRPWGKLVPRPNWQIRDITRPRQHQTAIMFTRCQLFGCFTFARYFTNDFGLVWGFGKKRQFPRCQNQLCDRFEHYAIDGDAPACVQRANCLDCQNVIFKITKQLKFSREMATWVNYVSRKVVLEESCFETEISSLISSLIVVSNYEIAIPISTEYKLLVRPYVIVPWWL